MDFLMVCHVAARFIGPDGQKFEVKAKDRGVFVTAPGWVKETTLFKGLLHDGSIVVADSSNKKELENDPEKGVTAEGKQPVDVKVKTPRKRKADDAK